MLETIGTAEEIRPQIAGRPLRQALDYWQSLPAKNGLPSRASIDPMAIPKLLPTTFIVRVLPDGGFVYQLAGTMIEEKYQLGTLRDKTPEEVMGPAASKVIEPYTRVRDTGLLFYREASMEWVHHSRKFSRYRVLLMPLGDDGASVDMIFGVQEFLAG
jgi:hypothetical protein